MFHLRGQHARLCQVESGHAPIFQSNLHGLCSSLLRIPGGFRHEKWMFGHGLFKLFRAFHVNITMAVTVLLAGFFFGVVVQAVLGGWCLSYAGQARCDAVFEELGGDVPILDDAVLIERVLDFHSGGGVVYGVLAEEVLWLVTRVDMAIV